MSNLIVEKFHHGNLDEEDEKNLYNLSNALKPNQWLRTTKFSMNDDLQRPLKRPGILTKPPGLWFSKGDWLYFQWDCENKQDKNYMSNMSVNIYLIEVNNIELCSISNEDGNIMRYDKSYYAKLDDFSATFITGDDIFQTIKFDKMQHDFKGFEVYPLPEKKYYYGSHNFLASYDVSSLVLWDKKVITKSIELGYLDMSTSGINNMISQIIKI